jgi:Protein of unknown function (DUF3501)
MQKVTLDEIVGPERYEKIRDDFRRRVIELKKHRRLSIGDRITFVFENHETVLFQIQEMLRAERITDIDKIRFEVDTYKLIGLDKAVSLQIGQRFAVPGVFEGGRSTEDNLSAVQYVRFPLSPEARAAFCEGKDEVRLVIAHPNYQAQVPLPTATRQSLAVEL